MITAITMVLMITTVLILQRLHVKQRLKQKQLLQNFHSYTMVKKVTKIIFIALIFIKWSSGTLSTNLQEGNESKY